MHGTSGGKAARVPDSHARRMVKLPHHDTLGCFFLNHPPVRKFGVKVTDSSHPLMKGIANEFEATDELYLIEPDMTAITPLLTTELPEDPSPEGFGFLYDEDTSLLPDGKTRVLGYEKKVSAGAVAYIALGHCHSPNSNSQPFVDKSVDPEGVTPLHFNGSWDNSVFKQLLENGMDWGLES